MDQRDQSAGKQRTAIGRHDGGEGAPPGRRERARPPGVGKVAANAAGTAVEMGPWGRAVHAGMAAPPPTQPGGSGP
jgi:hypothetical protein